MDNLIYRENLNRLRELQKDDHHAVRIAFCGKFKSGKSSLLNLLLGTRLPVKSTTATGSVTKIVYGRYSAIKKEDGTLQSIPAEEIGTYISIRGKDLDGVTTSDVQYAYIGSRSKLLKRGKVEFWDTPGLEDDPKLSQVTMDALEKCDMVVYVMHANQVLSQYEKRILPKLHKKMGGNILFVVNHIDELREEERKSVAEYVVNGLGEYTNPNYSEPNILYTSAKPEAPQIDTLQNAIWRICSTKESRLKVISAAIRGKAQCVKGTWSDVIQQDKQEAQWEREEYSNMIHSDITAKKQDLQCTYETCKRKCEEIQKALVEELQNEGAWRLVLLNYQAEPHWELNFVGEASKRIRARLNEMITRANSDIRKILVNTFLESDILEIQLNETIVWKNAKWYKNFSRPILFPEKKFKQYKQDCVNICIHSVMTYCVPSAMSGISIPFSGFQKAIVAHYEKALLEVQAEGNLTQGLRKWEAELSSIKQYESQMEQIKRDIDSANKRQGFFYGLKDVLSWFFPSLLNSERFG